MKHLLLKKMIFLSTQLYTPGCVCNKRDLSLGTKKADRKEKRGEINVLFFCLEGQENVRTSSLFISLFHL